MKRVWFIEDDKRLYPKVCFAERTAPQEGNHLGEIVRLHIPTNASSWHEYAVGVVDQYFDEFGETVPDVRTGSYDIEN